MFRKVSIKKMKGGPLDGAFATELLPPYLFFSKKTLKKILNV